jgi:hypothetical protein
VVILLLVAAFLWYISITSIYLIKDKDAWFYSRGNRTSYNRGGYFDFCCGVVCFVKDW